MENQQFHFDNSYARLPERFYERLGPTPVSNPSLIKVNYPLARQLRLEPNFLSSAIGVDVLAGNQIPEGSEPLAMAYAGQQFGGWVPQLGDGRAILLGEVIDVDGTRKDIQLKGSGRTSFSRSGDGRAWIGPILREYLVSEAMAALEIPTTRALAAVKTGEKIFREQALPGAIMARVASSHIRVGTFQFFAARQDLEGLKILAEYVINRHYPEVQTSENPYLGLLTKVVERQATLVAKWMGVGFIHGVMNTDNVLISGETIDYGPCAFMDTYDSKKVFSSIDYMGRYSYKNQPQIAQWNLASFASSIIPLINLSSKTALEEAQSIVNNFSNLFNSEWSRVLRTKIGLVEEKSGDINLAQDLLKRMEKNNVDFTLAFRRLAKVTNKLSSPLSAEDILLGELFEDPEALYEWLALWRQRLSTENSIDSSRQALMTDVNPAYIPRNHRIEQAINAAVNDDYSLFETLLEILNEPFNEQQENYPYQLPPRLEETVTQTFCGT